MTDNEYLDLLVQYGTAWVKELRQQHRDLGRPLHDEERAALAGFYEPRILDKTRLRFVPRIENPPFYAFLP